MTIEQIIQYIFSGITIGSIYAIVAIGFNIIYNATGIINFAQGEFIMLGGMIAYSIYQFLSTFIEYKSISLITAILISIIITTIIGALLEIIFIRKVKSMHVILGGILLYFINKLLSFFITYKFLSLFIAILISIAITIIIGLVFKSSFNTNIKDPAILQMIVITIGLSMLIREIALNIWNEQIRALPFFTGNEISSINIFGAHISPQVLWVVGIASLIVTLLSIFFKYTIIGKAMRACSANMTSAILCGINIKNMVTLSFMISAGIGALAGCVVSPLTQTSYDMGSSLAIKGFTVAIFGGLGNSSAAIYAGLLLGILESFSISILPNAYTDVIAIIILLFVLFFKPSGLFISKEKGEL